MGICRLGSFLTLWKTPFRCSGLTPFQGSSNVEFPLVKGPVMTTLQTSEQKRKVVLVVDDEQVIADTLAMILKGAGFDAIPLYSGEDAVTSCETLRPDLIITDVMMSGMNGIEAAIVIRRKLPDCKILLFSGQAATNDLLFEARSSGHDFELLNKPIHPVDLLARIRALSDVLA